MEKPLENMAECNMKYEREDSDTIEFEVTIPARGTKELTMHYNRRNLR